MQKERDKNKALGLSKLSFDTLKKTPQDKQCRSKDLPSLDSSAWEFFESSMGKLVDGCKQSLQFLSYSIKEFHEFKTKIEMEDAIFGTLSKSSSIAGCILKVRRREFHLQTLGEKSGRPLHELIPQKRTYSKVPKAN